MSYRQSIWSGVYIGFRNFIETRGGDIFMLACTLIGTYKIASRIIQVAFPPTKVDEYSRNIVTAMLNERSNSLELSDLEVSFANNIILPNMIDITFNDIGGLESIKEEIEQMIVLPFVRPELFRNPLLGIPKGILLYGPPGTGKTMLAKAIAKQSKAAFIDFRHEQILQAYVGESEKMISALFSLATKLQPTIIFIDEVDSFFSSRKSHDNQIFVRLQCMLLGLIDGMTTAQNSQVMILACTNRLDTLDPAFLRRMQRKIKVGLPTESERVRILRLKLRPEYVDSSVDFSELAAVTEHFSGSDLDILCRTAAQESLREVTRRGGAVRKIKMQDLQKALEVCFPTTTPTTRNNREYPCI